MSHSPNLIVTVDGAVTVEGRALVLIRRTKAPCQDRLVLPGGHVEEADATLEEACARELAEEVGLETVPERLSLLAVLNQPGADPRYPRRASVVYHADISRERYEAMSAGSDAAAIELVEIDALTPERLGFDHYEAVPALRDRLKRGEAA
jgi:ADP-ribose pyrophosphatase YjhB (NUDIX family)